MSFFESEVVRAEMVEISELQEDVYKNVFSFQSMTKEQKVKHVELLQKLLDKQKVLYTRLSLSDDPEAVDMKSRILMSTKMMGLADNVDMNIIFSNMNALVESMKEQIQKEEE
jgi:hypothetical protein